ncbi:MAG: ABC transporter ATP-binding protein [Clostridiales bacterium]|jgi:ABC-2 type transport system ATP-binding protein|nr:ABC transporter ATP-binding protein [Clostridiales bacterium]
MIDFQNVTKRFGAVNAVDGLTTRISGDGIHCLLGRNGAGKTTLMKLIAGHFNATDGRVTVDGAIVSASRQPGCVNFAESNAEQFNMRVSELIQAADALRNGFDPAFARRMAQRFDLDQRKRFKQLSFGMKTMLSTILTLANTSKVILLDEPALGLDAIMREQFNMLLQESVELTPRVIIVSTHLIDEIAKVARKLMIMDKGKVLAQADLDEVDERAYTLTGPANVVRPLTAGLRRIGETEVGGMLAAHIYDRRVTPPHGVTLERLPLQDFFVKLVGGGTRDE